MGLPNYPRPSFGPSVLDSSFGLKRGPGYYIGHAASLGLANGPASPFLQPYQYILITDEIFFNFKVLEEVKLNLF